MHGRDRERDITLGLVRGARAGPGGVVLIEGEPGIGKSALLGEAVAEAARHGFSLVIAAADELGQSVSFAPLLAALRESLDALSPGGSYPDTAPMRMWLVQQFRVLLEQRAEDRPVLVSLDNLQWADQATLFALRTLARQLASYPLVWNLARSTGQPGDGAGMLFDMLERDGAARITLGPLGGDAIAGVLTDALGAAPDAGLAALAAGAAGNPFLLVELLRGLREENAIQTAAGVATLHSARLPLRVQVVVRAWLDGLSGRVRPLLETAAVLGRSFRLEDVAEMLGEAPAVLLPLLSEALEAGLLEASAEEFAFRHGLVWRAVTEQVPAPVRLALHRQIGGILLARGGSAVAAGGHLLESARAGDSAGIAGLDQAAEEVLDSSPPTAAILAARALDLTLPGDPAWARRSARAAESLAAAGRADEAEGIARAALAQPLPASSAAPLRCALSSVLAIKGEFEEAGAEAATLLALPDLPGPLRDDALTAQLQVLSALRDTPRARTVAEATLAAGARHTAATAAGAQLVLAAISWEDGRVGRGLRHARGAVQRVSGISPDARHFQPLLTLAAMLVDLRMLEEASAIVDAAAQDLPGLRSSRSQAVPAILQARMDLARGRTGDAAVAAETALRTGRAQGIGMHSALALSMLGVIALRQGNVRAAAGHMRSRRGYPASARWYARTETLLAQAQITEAAAGPAAAMKVAGDVYTRLPADRSVLLGDPAAAAWLARTALAAGQQDRATEVARIAEEIAQLNPVFKIAATAAAHGRGIASRDQARLAQAAADHPDPWARASAAEDLAMLLASEGDTAGGVAHLDEALSGYGQASAARDVARVRRRLRRLGVRRRYWAAGAHDAVGWDSLTETEQAISLLVSHGLSNQEVAQQMYVSVHTVAAHLRQIFRKLGITSRVELTRLAIENAHRRERGRPPGRRLELGHRHRRDRG